jgi:SulP family sulfate permease
MLIRQSDPSECLYFIESGRVTARLELDGGKALRLRTMGPGSIVGEIGLFIGGKRTASIVADMPCTVYRLSQESLATMRASDPDLALAFHQFLVCLLAERVATTGAMLRDLQH